MHCIKRDNFLTRVSASQTKSKTIFDYLTLPVPLWVLNKLPSGIYLWDFDQSYRNMIFSRTTIKDLVEVIQQSCACSKKSKKESTFYRRAKFQFLCAVARH
jgi:hypothetical protein